MWLPPLYSNLEEAAGTLPATLRKERGRLTFAGKLRMLPNQGAAQGEDTRPHLQFKSKQRPPSPLLLT